MTKKGRKGKPDRSQTLRERAEKTVRTTQTDITKMTPGDIQRLVHELQIHQIELELQNQELLNAQVELGESLDRYSDLYEFAPVGYITLDKEGTILESNLTAARMLDVERKTLLQTNLSKFVVREFQEAWYLYRQAAFSSEKRQTCEIEMRKAGGTPLAVRLEGIAFGSRDNRSCRTALIDITEQKQTQEALHELSKTLERRVHEQTAQIRLQAEAIARLGEGVLITTGQDWLESQIVFVNEAVCRITGYTAGELIGQSWRILQGSGTDAETLNRIHRELSAGNPCQAELVSRRKDGTSYDVDLFVTPLRDASGQHTNFVSIHRDITERKRAEEALRESEQRFREMADHAPVMIWISGIDKLCTWFNKPWLDFTGRTLEQELGNGWADGIYPDDSERCLETYVTAFDAHQPFTREYRLRRHDGKWRWILDTGIPLYQESGAFVGYIGSCIDITQRKEGEEALHESEERLRTILDTAADSIITIDHRGIIVAANPAAERMFGYTLAELVGQNVKLLMPSPYREEHDGYITRYLETGKAHILGITREVVGLRKDGSTFPVDLSVSAVPHLGLFTGIHRDISARKQTELELNQYKNDLRAMASELMLAEERERQRLAQDLHDGIGQALFRARRKLDQASVDDEAAREIGTILDDIAKTLNTLTFELSPPVLRQLGLRAAIKWLVRDMKRRYGLSVQVDDDGQALALDERITLVVFRSLRELVINVAKHAQTDSATISLRKMDGGLLVTVEDQGKGFALTTQSHHVEAGHFGLFSIRERVEYLAGSFKIQSAPGEGTRVTLTLPGAIEGQEPRQTQPTSI